MNPHRILAALCCLAISVATGLGATGRRISDYTETLTIDDAWILEIAVPGVTNYKAAFGTIATNIIARSGGGTGEVSTAQLNTSSNAIVTLETTRNAAVSNAVVALELTRNASVSNSVVTLLVANDTTTSNGLYSVETTRNTAVSNSVVTLLVANDTTTSNGLYSVETTRNAAVSNAVVALIGSGGSTQMVAAAIGTLTITNPLSVAILNVGLMNLTNALGSNVVRMGYQDLTNILRRQTFFAPAGYMISNSTDGATFATEQSSAPTNRMSDRYTFSGAVTNVVGFDTVMPLNWDLSTLKVKLVTLSTNNVATTTNVWGIAAAAIKNGSVFTNIAWGTEVTITNTVSSTGGQELFTPATPAMTVGNTPAAAGNHVYFRIRRLPGHPDDSDGGQQNLLGAWVQYGETMSEVASW